MNLQTLFHARRSPSPWAVSLFLFSLAAAGVIAAVAILSLPWL